MGRVSIDRLCELFEYKDGFLIRKVDKLPRKKGDIVGSIGARGYLRTRIDYEYWQVHRVIYAVVHKRLPKYIDHIDGDKTNNKIENLRECSLNENGYNQKVSSRNNSGIKGVSWYKQTNRWKAYIQYSGKSIHLGYFLEINSAKEAVMTARKIYHREFANMG